MIGRILNSLNYLLEKEDKNWLQTNPDRRKSAYNFAHNIIVSFSGRPFVWSLTLLIGYLLLMFLFYKFPDLLQNTNINSNWTSTDVFIYFSSLWPIQAAIAGVIYPIVIGFVSILLQKSHSDKSILRIYLRDSGAILIGVSSLMLILGMTIQYALAPHIEMSTFLGWTSLNVVWFIINISGTIWFLIRTFMFLRPDLRNKIIQRYGINVILPREIKSNLKRYLFQKSQENSWLPERGYGHSSKSKNYSISLHEYGFHQGETVVKKHFKTEKMISNVYFNILHIPVYIWITKVQDHLKIKPNDTYELIFPITVGSSYTYDKDICKSIGGISLGDYEKFLIWLAFSFSDSTNKNDLNVADLLKDLASEAHRYILADDENSFESSLKDLSTFHSVLLRSTSFTKEDEQDNFAYLPSSSSVFGRELYLEWFRIYFPLYDEAVKKLVVNPGYFHDLIYVPNRLIARVPVDANIKIIINFLDLSSVLFGRLSKWWSSEIEKQGILSHNQCTASTLSPPYSTVYESTLVKFVGGWSDLKNTRFPLGRKEKYKNWDSIRTIGKVYVKHIDTTLYMFFNAISRGDAAGAEWLANVLQLWWEELRFQFDSHVHYLRNKNYLTIELLDREWSDVSSIIDMEMIGASDEEAPLALFSSILHNYWTDSFGLSLYLLIVWGKNCECENSLPASILKALINGDALKPGSSDYGNLKAYNDFNDCITSMLRQYYADGGYATGYREKLNNQIERIFELRKPEMVSGRIYSQWGIEGLDSLLDGQLFILIVFTNENWQPENILESTLRSWVANDDHKTRELRRELDKWIERLNNDDFLKFKDLFNCFNEFEEDNEQFYSSKDNLINSINKISTLIDNIRNEVIASVEISQARLNDVAKWSSMTAFKKETGDFPLPLFNNINYTKSHNQDKSLVFKKLNKGEYTVPELEQRASNEDDWYAENINQHVSSSVLALVLTKLAPTETIATTENVYWEKLKNIANEIKLSGFTPILLIDNRTRPEWVYQWSLSEYAYHEVDLPDDLSFSKNPEITLESYVGNVNDIEIYNSPVPPGASYVIAKESLDQIIITAYQENIYVEVEDLPIKGSNSFIDLKVTWSLLVNIKESISAKLVYVDN